MILPLLLGPLLARQAPVQGAPPATTGMCVLLTSEEEEREEAERERKSIVAGSLKGESAKAWIVRKSGWVVLLIRRSLVEDESISQAQRLLEEIKGGKNPARRTLGSMSASERRELAGFLAQSPLGRVADRLSSVLGNPNTGVGLAMRMSLSFEGATKGDDALALGLLPQNEAPPAAQGTGFEALEIPEEAKSVVLRFPRGFPAPYRAPMGAEALKALDALRKEKLDRIRGDMEKEAWARASKMLANPKSWDGRRPITFGELDPVIQAGVRQSNGDRKFHSSDKVAGARFEFNISLEVRPNHWIGTSIIPRA